MFGARGGGPCASFHAVLDTEHPITPFFDDKPERVLASLAAIERSNGKVSSMETLHRVRGEQQLRGHRNGLFAASIFGAPGSFGHIETRGVIHPCMYRVLVHLLGIDTPYVQAIARSEKALRGDKVIDDPLDREDGDHWGPRGLAEAVRARHPDHPLLPLLAITKLPVPPLAARPLRASTAPEAVDAWIGPVNEAWLDVIRLAYQDVRLHELETPEFILQSNAGQLQRAVDKVYQRTRRAERWLVPPMVSGDVEEIVAIAYADPERIVVQRGTGVQIVDITGRSLHRAPPCGCILRGVVDGRYAVFHDFQREIHPMFDEEGRWPKEFVEGGMNHIFAAISVLDVDTGAYLERAPANVPHTFIENDQPEELLLAGRSLDEVGGDRPAASAYTHDLRFAEISGDSTQIISLADGLTLVRPAEVHPDAVTESLELATGDIVEHEWDDQGGGGASAIAFANGRWYTLDHYGVLADHLGNEAIVIVPRADAAAFDPAGSKLALVVENELVILDRATRAIDARFPV